MTDPIRSDADRHRIVKHVAETAGGLATAPDTVSDLRARIDADIASIAAVRYDDTGGRSADMWTQPERDAIEPDRLSDEACEALAALDRALAHWSEGQRIIAELERRWPAPTVTARPGVGPCPPGYCIDHWAAEIKTRASAKRYVHRCRRCGDFRKREGYPCPPQVIVALAEHGDDWTHPLVVRAIVSTRPPDGYATTG